MEEQPSLLPLGWIPVEGFQLEILGWLKLIYSTWLVRVPNDFLPETSMALVLDLISLGRRAPLRSLEGVCLAKMNTSAADGEDKHMCTSGHCVHMDVICMVAASTEKQNVESKILSLDLSWNTFLGKGYKINPFSYLVWWVSRSRLA